MTNLKSLFRFFSASVKLQPLYIGKLFHINIKKKNYMYTVSIELHVHIIMLSIQKQAYITPLLPNSFFSTGKDFGEARDLQ